MLLLLLRETLGFFHADCAAIEAAMDVAATVAGGELDFDDD